jgi:hypothetical protein
LFIQKQISEKLISKIGDQSAIISASGNGHEEIVEDLLADEKVDPSAQDNLAICVACQHGHLGVVQLLVMDPRVNVAVKSNYPIRLASQFGHYEVVLFLLSLVMPFSKDLKGGMQKRKQEVRKTKR